MTKVSSSDHCGHLKGFPYRPDVERYLIQKRKQRAVLWKQLLNPKKFCAEMERSELIWKVLFWAGILLAMSAIVVTLVKELDEGVASEDTILHLSVAELLLAIGSIITSLSKHSIKYNSVILLQKNIKTARQKSDDAEQMSNRKMVYILAFITCGALVSTILVGFLVLHFKDDDSHESLKYTKYTTTLSLFLALALDGVINDIISDVYSKAQADQYRLLMHQLHLELKMHQSKANENKRIKEIENFLDSSELFQLDHYFVKDSATSSVNEEKIEIEKMIDDDSEAVNISVTGSSKKAQYLKITLL